MATLALLEQVRADQWSAIAAWVTVIVALVAGFVAWRQLREARRLRREQAQPYVAVYIEPVAANPLEVDIVVRNFGATAAHAVELTITPTPRCTGGRRGKPDEDLRLPESFPTLVPGQEWRTHWDDTVSQHESNLPDVYEAKVRFRDSRGRPETLLYALDWKPLIQRGYIVTRTIHDVGEALRDIRTEIKRWSRPGSAGIRVWARDGDARAEREREARERRSLGPGSLRELARSLKRRLRRPASS